MEPILKLEHNSSNALYLELLDTNIIQLITKAAGITPRESSAYVVAPGFAGIGIWLYSLDWNGSEAYARFGQKLFSYANDRRLGHSKEYLLMSLTNNHSFNLLADSDLRMLLTNRLLVASSLKRMESGFRTNKARPVIKYYFDGSFTNGTPQLKSITNKFEPDEICRWVQYVTTDRDIAWRYVLHFKGDGRLDRIDEDRCDAKEYELGYRNLIKSIDAEVEAEMKRNGSFGRFGSIHSFWRLKQNKLKSKGVDWKSPYELNPGVNYD